MINPFKFGTIVDGNYFTDRHEELDNILMQLNSENHLILISPRRFGKTSLVAKAVGMSGRQSMFINLQKVVSTVDLASALLKELFKLHPWEKLKFEMSHFRVVPTISTNPLGDNIEVAFQSSVNSNVALEDSFTLLQKMSNPDNRMIVVLDEFQEIMNLEKGIDRRLRAIMQELNGLNFIILGSQESMMTEIFERKKSPFYHFGTLMHLQKIPQADFHQYIKERLPECPDFDNDKLADGILAVTACHPYYTQQLSSQVWNIMEYRQYADEASDREDKIVQQAVNQLTQTHDLDFERLWQNLNNTDKKILQTLCSNKRPSDNRTMPASTAYSSLNRLIKIGYIIKTDEYEVEDPFFRKWITMNRI